MTKEQILAKKHTKWTDDERGALEYALRDAYAAGANAAYSGAMSPTAAEYAEREAPKIALMLADE